ncbi:MAG: twin-arginine translocation pathway signal protein, partial [Acetobacteraceae bacterium]|nr:twin-arginine translocation pathway signal protein [Acetobacteraceae bacterium]
MLPRRALAALLPVPAHAQEARPIRLVVAFPPGGSADLLGRLLAPGLAERLGAPVVVENRAGAGGAVGAGAVAQAAPDGQTLLLDTGGQTVNPHLLRGLAFDYARAFAPVALLVTLPLLLVVRPEVPAGDLPALLAWLRADAARAAYGSVGVGARTHLAMAALLRRAGLAGNHVPYRGGAEQVAGLLRGDVAMGFTSVALAAPLLREGRLRAVAASGAARVAGVPTVAEQGFPGFALGDWIGLLAP